jgi:hypothetical protein
MYTKRVERLYGENIEESDGFAYRDPEHTSEAVLGIIKILR